MGMSPRLLRPRASGFDPKTIPNLVSWYDASDTTTLFQNSNGTTAAAATDDPVGYWKDKFGSNNIIQATANNRPVLKLTGLNGRRAVYFDGVNDVLRATPSSTIGAASVSMFSVWAVDVAGAYVSPPLILGSGPNARPYDRWQSATQNFAYVGSTFANASLVLRTKTTPFVYSLEVVKDGSSSGVHTFAEYANGVLSGPYSVTSTYSTTSQVISVGSRADGNTMLNAWASEMLLINGVPTASLRTAIQTYLAKKWGVTL
jgi:hypothetical protein